MKSPVFTYFDIKCSTSKSIYERAVKLFQQGCVGSISKGRNDYSAIVQGTQPYQVNLSINSVDDSTCTCYMGQNKDLCKHVLALALAVLDKSGSPFAGEEPSFENIKIDARNGTNDVKPTNQDKIISGNDRNTKYLLSVLEKTRSHLLDTSRRNRLLNYKESAKDVAIIDEMPDQVYDHLVLNKSTFYFKAHTPPEENDEDIEKEEPDRTLPQSHLGEDDLDRRYKDNVLQTPYLAKDLERKLRRLFLDHRGNIEETGANNLYLAAGFLRWKDRQDEPVYSKAPLVLIPVKLERERGTGVAVYSLSFDDSALDTNFSLYEKLKHNFDITLPSLAEEQMPEEYWSEIEKAIQPCIKEGWSLIREMSLGLFRFNKQVMWHDLHPDRWPSHSQILDKNMLKRILLGSDEGDSVPGQLTHEYPQDESVDGKSTEPLPLIRDADSSQYAALMDALSREDGLVIEGPPGTGKSQTITNLIASALAQGQSVLFVAEKMAALEVVYKRLEETGLGRFCLQLHGLKTNKKELLKSVLDRFTANSLDVSELAIRSKKHEQLKKDLVEFSKAMNERVGPEELPLHQALWRVERLKQALPNTISPIDIDISKRIDIDNFLRIKDSLDDLCKEWTAILPEARTAWRGFTPKNIKDDQSTHISKCLGGVVDSIDKLTDWLNNNDSSLIAPSIRETSRLVRLAKSDISDILPQIPAGCNITTAYNIVHDDKLEDYDELVDDIKGYLDTVHEINDVFDYSSPHSDDYVALLQRHTNHLIPTICKPDDAIEILNIKKTEIDNAISKLGLLEEVAKPVFDISDTIARTLEDYKSVADLSKRLGDGPTELSLHANSAHARPSIRSYLKQAQDQHDDLIGRYDNLKLFYAERAESTNDIYESLCVIRNNKDKLVPQLSKGYRHAKRTARALMRNPKLYSRKEGFISELNQFVDVCRSRDEYASNKTFISRLGSLFRGLNTDWNSLTKIVDYSQSLKEDIGLEEAQQVLRDWNDHVDKMEEVYEGLYSSIDWLHSYAKSHSFPNSMWQRPIKEMISTITPWVEKIDDAISDLAQDWCNIHTSFQCAIDITSSFRRAREKEGEIQSKPVFESLIGHDWKRSDTPYEQLKMLSQWLHQALASDVIDIEILRWLISDRSTFNRQLINELRVYAISLNEVINKQVSDLSAHADIDSASWIGGNKSTIQEFKSKISTCIDTLSSLPLIQRWHDTNKQIINLGLSTVSDEIISDVFTGNEAGMFYEYSVYRKILDERIRANQLLATFSHLKYENLRERYSKADKEILKYNADLITNRLCKMSIPNGIGHGRVSEYTEKRLLSHEANKQKRHIPIRQLLKRAGNALQACKPCFLMSPLSVAQYLAPGEIEFDLVVMDEASQIKPEDALGAIARGRKIVIVGDPKQLPPTSFFDSSVSDDEDAEESIMDDTESILDVCLKQLPYRRLRWHYRSQHESLIQFSNDKFYDGDLIVFPSPKGTARDYGVHHTFIDKPSYKQGRNRSEAEVVVENIIHHFHRHKAKSLGVAAFNKRQAEEIQLLLDKARSDDPGLDDLIADHESDEKLFIKNLENVQGDERDVIFISTTYGPEKAGDKVFQRFGPINSDLGWRRLNVIATRARQRVELFTSMRPTDILAGDGSRRGVRALRDYIEYAATGKIVERGLYSGREPDSDFEIAVAKILGDLGYEYCPQVGVSGFYIDIGVRHPDRPGEYLMGIECDGATYHSSKSVRDRDRLRQEILENKGWFIHRIWSTSWFHARSAEIDRLRNAIEQQLENDRRVVARVAEYESVPEIIEHIQHATSDDLEREQAETVESLENALERFWEKNIASQFPVRKTSVLSPEAIGYLVRKKPENKKWWYGAIPMELRQKINSKELVFLDDILELISEYC